MARKARSAGTPRGAETEGEGRIRPRARLLRTIGAELISSEIVAVIELVRNCYDADATEVQLVFERPESAAEGSLEIRDNGHGMTREILLGPWLEPATDHKAVQTEGAMGGERSPKGRRRLGSKGVGRFAAQRLGSHLAVFSFAGSPHGAVEADFDWGILDEGRYLDEIRIPWRETNARRKTKVGTCLRITRLSTPWTPDAFERLKLGLARLVSPTVRQTFRVEISINGASEEIRPALEAENAMYSLKGEVLATGQCRMTYKDLSGTVEEWERTVVWPEAANCGPFSFQLNAWDLDSIALRHFFEQTGVDHGLRNFRSALRDHSGVSLFRDGFRILPYGEPDNDWLRLDRRRVNNPTMRLSNNQVLGHIHLTADTNPELRDQTNREGLVTNDEYTHLREVALELMQALEVRRFSARRSMDLSSHRKSTSLPGLEDDGHEERLDVLIDAVAHSGETQAMELRGAFREIRELARESVTHYAALASAGHMAGLVFRQLEHPIRQIRSDLSLVLGDLGDLVVDEDDRGDLVGGVTQALQHLETMAARMQRLDPLAIGGRGRRVSPISLDDALSPVVNAFREEGDRLGVSIDYASGSDLELVSNREVAQHALANLLDNAIWWSTQSEAKSPIVRVRLSPTGFSVSDNGPGVRKEHADLIYQPNFTMRPGAHGLGLTLVRDLLNSVGGRVRLAKRRPARFEVQLMAS
jgi:signal transduction histidine kinase